MSEELKAVLEMVKSLSDSTGTVAVWWLAMHYGIKLVSIIVGALVGGGAIYAAWRLIENIIASVSAAHIIARMYGFTEYSSEYRSHRDALIKLVRESKDKADKVTQ